MNTLPSDQSSAYLQYLPASFQEVGGEFLGRFLLAFEKILSGLPDTDEPDGIEQIIDRIASYFDPKPDQPGEVRAPVDFLPWLAGWVALSLRDDWDEEQQRRFISRMVPLYRKRGTKAGLIEILSIYTGIGLDISEGGTRKSVQVIEYGKPFTVGPAQAVKDETGQVIVPRGSELGVDAVIGDGIPHYFRVVMNVPDNWRKTPLMAERRKRIAAAIIAQEKPAHTYFDLDFIYPTLQIGVYSTVGVDTLLGTPKSG